MLNYPVVLLDVGETLVGPAVSFGDVYARVLAEMDDSGVSMARTPRLRIFRVPEIARDGLPPELRN